MKHIDNYGDALSVRASFGQHGDVLIKSSSKRGVNSWYYGPDEALALAKSIKKTAKAILKAEQASD